MHPDVAAVLPGAKNVTEIEEAARCSDAPLLEPEEMARIAALYRKDFR
jgi:aryl-alcohol dehydrogenase-like predicted oxidoreductase